MESPLRRHIVLALWLCAVVSFALAAFNLYSGVEAYRAAAISCAMGLFDLFLAFVLRSQQKRLSAS